MSLINSKKKEDVRKIILALLMSRKGATPLSQLDKEYAEQEDDRIPWKEFGHTSLLDFLRTMPECIRIEMRDGMNYVQGIPSDRSKHVNSLVTRQRSPRTRRKTADRRKCQLRAYYRCPHSRPRRARVPADIMAPIVQYVKQSGEEGVSKDYVFQKIKDQLPHSDITGQDLEDYVKNISHELCMKNNFLYAINKENPLAKDVKNETVNSKNIRYCVSGEDDEDSAFVFRSRDATPLFQFKRAKMPTSMFIEDTASDYTTAKNFQEAQCDLPRGCCEDDTVDCIYSTDDKSCLRSTSHNANMDTFGHARALISERTRLRLKGLIEKYPDGIWCFQLPNAYEEEYKVPLNYAELGFDSVLHFASHLPEIFTYANVANPIGDFKLYSANSRPLQNEHTQVGEKEILPQVSDEIQRVMNAIPPVVTSRWSEQLIPNHVMRLGESVGQMYVTDLIYAQSPVLEVLVVEVFNPSFFWVHLRGNTEHFNDLMVNINYFYNLQGEDYLMPAIVLRVGMNCACMYQNTWHRGIIKSVQSDLSSVIVMFYDYGTLKAYEPHAVYFLHRQFTKLPAQALPCGLDNVKPREGHEWPRSVTHRFAVRTDKLPLAATIKSIDGSDNSMMITLTDTLGEEDVDLSVWLVQENLASHGKLVGIRIQNFPFQYHSQCREMRLNKDSNASDALGTSFEMGETVHSKKQCRPNLALQNLYANMKRMRAAIESRTLRSDDDMINRSNDNSDVGTSGSGDSADRKCQTDGKLFSLCRKSSRNSRSREYVSDSEESYTSSTMSDDIFNVQGGLNVSEEECKANSGVYTNDLEYFGTFESLCGGHGRMEHIDWSVAFDSTQRNGASRGEPQGKTSNDRSPVGIYTKPKDAQNVRYDENQVRTSMKESDAVKLDRAFFHLVQKTDHCLLHNEDTCFPLESNIIKTEHATQSVTQRKKLLNVTKTPKERIVIPKSVYSTLRDGTATLSDSSCLTTTLTRSDALSRIREQYGTCDSDPEEVTAGPLDDRRLLAPGDLNLNGHVEHPAIFSTGRMQKTSPKITDNVNFSAEDIISDEDNLQQTPFNDKGGEKEEGKEEEEAEEGEDQQQQLGTSRTLVLNDREDSAIYKLYCSLYKKANVHYPISVRNVRAFVVENILSQTRRVECNRGDAEEEGSTSDVNSSISSLTSYVDEIEDIVIENNAIHLDGSAEAEAEAVNQSASKVSVESNGEKVESSSASNVPTTSVFDSICLKSKDVPAYNDEDVESDESVWDACSEVGGIIGEMLSIGSPNVDKVDIPNVLQYTEEHLFMGIETYISDTGRSPSSIKEDHLSQNNPSDSLYNNISLEILKLQKENSELRAELQSIHVLLMLLMERKNAPNEFSDGYISQSAQTAQTMPSEQLDDMILNVQRNLNIGGPSWDSHEHKSNEQPLTEQIIIDGASNTYSRNRTMPPGPNPLTNTQDARIAPAKTHLTPEDYLPGISLPVSGVSKRFQQVLNDSMNLPTQQGITEDNRNFFPDTSTSSDIPESIEFSDTNPFKVDILADAMPITKTTIDDSSRDREWDGCNNSNTQSGAAVTYQALHLENLTGQCTAAMGKTKVKRRAVFKTSKPRKYGYSKLKKSQKRAMKNQRNSSALSSLPNGKASLNDNPTQPDDNQESSKLANRSTSTGTTGLSETSLRYSPSDEGYGTRPSTCTLRHSPEMSDGIGMPCNRVLPNFPQSVASFVEMPTAYSNSQMQQGDRKKTDFTLSSSGTGSSLRFYAVVLTSTVTYIFHCEETAWMSVDEFFDLFTKYTSRSKLLQALQTINIDIPLKEIERIEEAHVFSQLDSTSLKASRNANNRIESILLMPLKLGLRILDKLNALLPRDVHIADNQKPSSFNSLLREMAMLIEAHDAILENMRASSAQYHQ